MGSNPTITSNFDAIIKLSKCQVCDGALSADAIKYGSKTCSVECKKARNRTIKKDIHKKCLRVECSADFVTKDVRTKYCGQSCAAIASNTRRPRTRRKCVICGTESYNAKYCSNNCASSHLPRLRPNVLNLKDWIAGLVPANAKNGTLSYRAKHHLYEMAGWKCSECGWGENNPVLGRPILAIDHIDGDHKNNWFTNLKVLCYNCHTMTPTFGALNRGKTPSPRSVHSRKKSDLASA